jgi:hypothetical protein
VVLAEHYLVALLLLPDESWATLPVPSSNVR